PENRHGGTSSTDPNVSIGTGVITYQIVHNDAVLKSSNSEVKNRSEITKVFTNGTTFHYEQTFDTVRTWVYE
ncbi:MAG: hypothetical protein JWO82_1833, partial [Akkermansiaceae bacterium]|nr:hypothetical protein [Akkermansiaceae bacterium]